MSEPSALRAFADGVPLVGDGAPINDGTIAYLIRYALTIYKRSGNVPVSGSFEWGAQAQRFRDAQSEELERLQNDRSIEIAAHAMLLQKGYRPCDIPACNCNDWHPRVPSVEAKP